MEEILASIRKIIESNEPGAGKSISATLPPVYSASNDDDDIHLTVDDELDTVSMDDVPPVSSDPRFIAANSPGAVRQPEEPARTMSLADVAARVRAAAERNPPQAAPRELPPQRELPPAMIARFAEVRREPIAPPPARSTTTQAEVDLMSATSAIMADLLSVSSDTDVDEPQARADEHPVEAFAEAAAAPVAVEVEPPVVADEPVADVYVEPRPVSVPQAAAAVADPAPVATQILAASAQTLLSESVGKQVARSFEELTAVVDGAQRRSLDEIAQDMLRPMLQEWLDDNLPTLVERLVREEIERVARGPRR